MIKIIKTTFIYLISVLLITGCSDFKYEPTWSLSAKQQIYDIFLNKVKAKYKYLDQKSEHYTVFIDTVTQCVVDQGLKTLNKDFLNRGYHDIKIKKIHDFVIKNKEYNEFDQYIFFCEKMYPYYDVKYKDAMEKRLTYLKENIMN